MAEYDGDKVVITYDLVYEEDPDALFRVTLFNSTDNYRSMLLKVTGDVGVDIKPGKGKRIVWYARNKLPAEFNDQVTFKMDSLSPFSFSL